MNMTADNTCSNTAENNAYYMKKDESFSSNTFDF